MKHPKILLPLTALTTALLSQTAHAHGFGERYDLPIPLTFFAVGGAAAVLLSFVFMGSIFKAGFRPQSYPRFNLFRYPWIEDVLSGPRLLPVKIFSVFLLALVILTSLLGSSRPEDNFSPTFVWVIWWVGMGFLVALLGNLWALVNPWKIIFGWADGICGQIKPDRKLTLGKAYPERWGVWPAVILFFTFSLAENALVEGGTDPLNLAVMTILYSSITFGGMFLFGKHQWLRHGEAFSVVFGFLSRFSITEVRANNAEVCQECSSDCRPEGGPCIDCYECFEYAKDREFNLRPPAVGLNNTGQVTPDVMAMVMLLLATVTFDGFSATPEWQEVQVYFIIQLSGWSMGPLNGGTIANTLGLIGFPLSFAVLYWSFSYLIHRMVGRQTSVEALGQAFVFTLIPIALAYNYAHFLSFLLISGQQIIPLVSDPFGAGLDLFGTADYVINIRVTSPKFVWFFSVAVIVAGHIIGVYLAHVRAMLMYPNRSIAAKSQLPMLGLMVFYTVVSLWIVSRPITG